MVSTKHLGWIAAVGAVVSSLYGGLTFVDDRYAKTAQVQLLELRVEEKILTDRFTAIQQRMWKIEERYGDDLFEAPGTVKEEYQQMKHDRSRVRQEIRAVLDSYRREGYQASEHYYDYEQPNR